LEAGEEGEEEGCWEAAAVEEVVLLEAEAVEVEAVLPSTREAAVAGCCLLLLLFRTAAPARPSRY
jgi:hypothetical protein